MRRTTDYGRVLGELTAGSNPRELDRLALGVTHQRVTQVDRERHLFCDLVGSTALGERTDPPIQRDAPQRSCRSRRSTYLP
jgi:class 3 adenylate cyclase